MPDVIRLLPDSVANQIAAGEVIQRPGSVVKELVENAVDAGATEIRILVRDAGKTAVQVIDNGCGMSETDARMSFERHATSKISKADDLFSIRTMGFRGEALPSIVAVAQVEMKTRRHEDELGTLVEIHGSELIRQESVATTEGTNILVRNLFYNIPARRKFLKTDSTELKHIITEFQRIALAQSSIAFSLYHNQTEIYNLPAGPLRQRIMHIFGKSMNQNLVQLETETSIVRITGFVGKPEFARKTYGEQFFFVNNRFMRHAYFHKAVTEAYDLILPPDSVPAYFLFLDILPEQIDVNIHPTKTEIKFEDERAIWQILHAAVRESLGKFNITPSLDFDRDGVPEIPSFSKHQDARIPEIPVRGDYNPFDSPERPGFRSERPPSGWESLYEGIRKAGEGSAPDTGGKGQDAGGEAGGGHFFQFKNRYILTPVKSGLMIIDQKRAHERILFESFLEQAGQGKQASQKNLFPVTLELDAADHLLLTELMEPLRSMGFEIRDLGNYAVIVDGVPGFISHTDPKPWIEQMLESYKSTGQDPGTNQQERIARSLAVASAIPYGKALSPEEMQHLVDSLFASRSPNYSPSGKPVLYILPMEEFEKWFKP